MDTNGWKTQSRTTKALQSLSSKSKEEKSTKRTLGHKTGPCSLQKRETRVKDGEQWPRVWDFSGLWAGWHFGITNHTEGTVAAGELHRRQTRAEESCYRSPPASGPGRGSPGVLEFSPVSLKPSVQGLTHSQFPLLFSNFVWNFLPLSRKHDKAERPVTTHR